MSSDLQFLLLKNYNTHLFQRNGAVLSRDPSNISGLNGKSSSGLINSYNVNVVKQDDQYYIIYKDTDYASQFRLKDSIKRQQVNSVDDVRSFVDKHNPAQTNLAIAKYLRLQRSGSVSKSYNRSNRHQLRRQKRHGSKQ